MNKETHTNLVPVTIIIVEDTDFGDSMLRHPELAPAMLHDGHSLERAGHLFSCHKKWSYGDGGERVDCKQNYELSLGDATNPASDLICIVDCYLGDAIERWFQSPFNDRTHLPESLLRNRLSHPGLAFAKQVLEKTEACDQFVFVAFANTTIHDKLWEGLSGHADWVPYCKRFDYIPSLPGCNDITELRGAIARCIDLFLNAKGFGSGAEDRIREGTAYWFPDTKPITQ